MASSFTHHPALLHECLSWLSLEPGALVVDGTVGGGGHAAAILEGTAPDGRLLALDLDPEALAATSERLRRFGDRVVLQHSSFRRLREVLDEQGIETVDAVLLDLGVSSHQLDVASRGFRFAEASAADTPLDMRMNPTAGTTAAQLLRDAHEVELAGWFHDYADLPGSRRLARAIVASRERAPQQRHLDPCRRCRPGFRVA